MNPQERVQFLYTALVFSSNALSVLKFSTKTIEFDSNLTTFNDLAVNAYYALYINLAALFDTRKDAPSLESCIRNNKSANEKAKGEDLDKFKSIKQKHSETISKVMDIRKKAVAHVSNDLMSADLTQDSMGVQVLIEELVGFYHQLKSITIDPNKPEIHAYEPKIRDDLGQRELWNSKHQEIVDEILSSNH